MNLIPTLSLQDRDALMFWGCTLFALVWWGRQLITLPGTWHEFVSRLRDVRRGGVLPVLMQLMFLTVWWLVPLAPIWLWWERYLRYGSFFWGRWTGQF